MKLQPYEQGSLDSLCGVYALINASRIAYPQGRSPFWETLFNESIDWLCRSGAKYIYEGLSSKELMSLCKAVFRPRIKGLKLKRPLLRVGLLSEPELAVQLEAMLGEPGAGVIVGIDNYDWGHWSVLRRMTPYHYTLFDSDGLKRLRRGRGSVLARHVFVLKVASGRVF